MSSIRSDQYAPYGKEHDACALIMSTRKRGQSTYGTLKRALQALTYMGHRTGLVDGEGDGAGVQTDIPRQLWALRLSRAGLRSSIATEPGFWVGHCFVPREVDFETIRDQLCMQFNTAGLNLLIDEPGRVRVEALGRQGRATVPRFFQFAGFAEGMEDLEQQLFYLQNRLETSLPVHFTSLSADSVVYKVRGTVEVLTHFYPDLQNRDFTTAMALCHARYSTNTASSFARVQPFALLGHNGEINTIDRFRREAKRIGAQLDPENSDSQDIDRALHMLCVEYGLTLVEAIEMIFPPIPHEVEHMPVSLREVYKRFRHTFGPFAQGPAAVVARYGDLAIASVDALGLRPLWFIETEKEYLFSSERGVTPIENMVSDPRPLAPGEKMALRVTRGRKVEVFDHADIRQHVMKRAFTREAPQLAERYWSGWDTHISVDRSPVPVGGGGGGLPQLATATETVSMVEVATKPASVVTATPPDVTSLVLAATGWNRDHLQELKAIVDTGKDLVGSLGYDGPLAVLSQGRVNIADFFKENVAVVTNPAIDRQREAEAFSTQTVVGTPPQVGAAPMPGDVLVVLETPLLPGGHPILGDELVAQTVASQVGTLCFEDLVAQFGDRVAVIDISLLADETVQVALDRLADEACDAVRNGAQCVVLDDSVCLTDGLGWLDPHLVTNYLDHTLSVTTEDNVNLRRQAGIVVRSASVRSLHDLVLLYGMGADAVNPYAMLAVAIGADKGAVSVDEDELIDAQVRLFKALTVGLEKVISTIGCHELRGYGHIFSSVGLAPTIAELFDCVNYFGNEDVGLTWNRLHQEALERAAIIRKEFTERVGKVDRFYPKFWKKVEAVARGEMSADEFIKIYRELSEQVPVALRHALGIRTVESDINPAEVDLGVDIHDMPMLISAMSFGSQGELAYRAYAEAAKRLNIVCVNGEGGELPELIGRYKDYRGQQVASGRFGVNAEFLNSAYVIEIKVGQGAKPGEGGMLPAHKVTAKVAEARRTPPFVALLSPSNNHDIYSIEDLAQLIEELKAVNPFAKISVKIPVVAGVGLIAVGVAKAGADVINITGYDGGTGAARRHALQYVGLPAEIGVIQSHRALTEAGLRDRVELWCDGGMRSGADAVKMILLGANRVGFGTMAMVAMGCTICRKCHEGTCHVGITTHIATIEEAQEKGLKSFRPRDAIQATEGIVRVFEALGEEMRRLTAELGANRLQDLVGRADLLDQVACLDQVDLSSMLTSAPKTGEETTIYGGRRLTRPRNILTKVITDVMMDAVHSQEREVIYQDTVMAHDRALGSHLAGEIVRRPEISKQIDILRLEFGPSAVAGNGFAAWTADKMDIVIQGGAQDGAAKSASGGRVAIMKGVNHKGRLIDGSVGKSFAYGAQQGVLIVQGDADSRACIRLSGADVIFGGEITEVIDDTRGLIGSKANLKGFACEYMTSGRVLILGDPGPYAFAGMTGGVVYQQLSPEFGFDEDALRRRFAKGSTVMSELVQLSDVKSIQELLQHYMDALLETDQYDTAMRVQNLMEVESVLQRFVKVVPQQ